MNDQPDRIPRVSVVIPCYNAAPWLREAVESTLGQEGVDVEVIVVDDGSTDGSLDTIADLAERVVILRQPNRGGNHARNRGVERATGAFIQYLDADDYLLPGKLATQTAAMQRSGSDISYTDWRYLVHDGDATVVSPIEVPGHQSDPLTKLLGGWWFALSSALLTRQATSRLEWDERLTVAQDSDYWYSAALLGLRFEHIRGGFAIWRRHGSSSVSTSDPPEWNRSQVLVLDRALDRCRTAPPASASRSTAVSADGQPTASHHRPRRRCWTRRPGTRRRSPGGR